MNPISSLREIHRCTIETYEQQARAWAQQRASVFFEKAWLDRFIALLPAQGTVLDLGCGAGLPIAEYLIESGFALTGVDASSTMIELSRTRFPKADWVETDMRALSLPKTFDGIVAWDSFFHLTPDAQRATLPILIKHLNVGGAVLLTIGHEAGEVFGTVNGAKVYHASLEPSEYQTILMSAGFQAVEIVLRDKSCGEHSVLLASQYR